MSPELRHLRSFLALAEELNFSAAADRLFVSQQSLSRTIQQLERELGTELFTRTTRSVELTPAGAAMLGSAAQAASAADDATEIARRVGRGEASHPLRVDISSGGLETGATLVRRLRREQPELVVEQAEHGVAHGLRLLREGRLDVLLGITGRVPREIRTELIRREPVMLGMTERHPFARLNPVPVSALADVELLLPSEESAPEWLDLVAAFCREAGVTARRWPGVTHGSVAAAEVVREGRCVVPTARWLDPPAGVVFRRLTDPVPIIPWSLMWAASGEERVEVRAFLRLARAVSAAANWLAPGEAEEV